jgi:Family of unknown function (DUF5996)
MTLQPLHALFADQHAAELACARLATLGILYDKLHTFSSAGSAHIGSFADSDNHAHTFERDHIGSFVDSDNHVHTAERDDSVYSHPYLYAYAYPMPEGFAELPLLAPATWNVAPWKGMILHYDDLRASDDPEALIEATCEAVYQMLAPTLA